MITLAVLMFLYFLPTVVASERGHSVGGIFILNFLLGWTVIGWFVLLLWALVSRPPWCYVAVPVPYPYYGWRRYQGWFARCRKSANADFPSGMTNRKSAGWFSRLRA